MDTHTLLGGWILFLLAIAGFIKRLFLLVMYSLNEGDLSGNGYGLVTSLRYGCLLNANCNLCSNVDPLSSLMWVAGAAPVKPTVTLFKFWTHLSTAKPSPSCTIAVPSLDLRNLIWK